MRFFLNPRTIASLIRTATYGSLAGYFAISDASAIELVDAVVVGAVAADYSTWFLRSIGTLSDSLLHGCYDGLVNLLFGCFLYQTAVVDTNYSGEGMAVAFLTFLAVLGLKVAFYAIRYFEHSLED